MAPLHDSPTPRKEAARSKTSRIVQKRTEIHFCILLMKYLGKFFEQKGGT